MLQNYKEKTSLNNIELKSDVEKGLLKSYIDISAQSKYEYQSRLLINDKDQKTKVLTSIINELRACNEFFFSVAFVTNSGVATLINTLKELEDKGIKGKILASQYQNFTQPRALERLLEFKNIQLRIITEGNFHAKGYIFRHSIRNIEDVYTLIVGSSNLTAEALSTNKEWNLKVTSLSDGALLRETLDEFNKLYDNAVPVTKEWITEYDKIYNEKRYYDEDEADEVGLSVFNKTINLYKISPNNMQVEALNALDNLRKEGKNKALIISATGTGKTYLSAFDVKKCDAKKLLFVVHRENIARAAKESFEKVFRNERTMGLFTGSSRDINADFIFSTVQSISKPEYLAGFDKNEFDYIIIDEVHRSGAESYKRVIDYFKPKFMLGMSATPERTDGYDIFKAFDYNIAYEIRLQGALEARMLAPFHYYGVTDIYVNGNLIDDEADFNSLVSDERVKRIIEHSKFYKCDSGRIKGLIFCSRQEEAKELSNKLNLNGYKTRALTGSSSEEEREESILLLESDDDLNYLDYVITVDIFNEGVDIPKINQIVMLRPTQSAIIFVQQLGRGLRKAPNKEFLTVIDFIGNYKNNYLIPIALYGDNSYNKDTIRHMTSNGSDMIPGVSTVNFDEISRKKIYEAIDKARVNTQAQLLKDYELLKYKIGHIPMMKDFTKYGMRDPYIYVDKHGSLYSFISKYDSTSKKSMSPLEERQHCFLAKEVCNSIRIDEPAILEKLLVQDNSSIEDTITDIKSKYGIVTNESNIISAINFINGKFHKANNNKWISDDLISYDKSDFSRTDYFSKLLDNDTFRSFTEDSISYSINTYINSFKESNYNQGFILYDKYSRKDVCRILNWDSDDSSTVYGYRIKHNTCPIFVTYSKSNDISSSINYEDYFIDNNTFHWMTRNKVKLDSPEVMQIKQYKKTGLRICLFIKKSDAESSDFYYMGDITPYEYNDMKIVNDKGKSLPIVNINFKMVNQVQEHIYKYLIS